MSDMGVAQVIMIIIAITTIGIGVITGNSDTKIPEPTSTPLPTPSPLATVTPSPLPTFTPTPTLSPTTSSPSDSPIYPGSLIVSITGNTTKLTSTDSPDDVFKWYQDQIKKLELSSTSIAKTNTNDNFLASLSGADGDTNIQIKIQRKSGEKLTSVELVLKQ
jgi:hypothetical protein